MDQPGFRVLHILLGLSWAQLGAAQQSGCNDCYMLRPSTIAGIVLGDLLLTLLIALAVYFVARHISCRSAHSGGVNKAQNESPYEELQAHRMDVYSDLKTPQSTYK
ncbi:TYRO protein tyrosine kinase-binding protein [Varanus komodoensis]|uniref:TYRO protein tyrosine kinase-binding protein n=1 Tax=Varanus komodoensis TaxID=61221 RepID=A0A8D2JDR8_VARKO|nr:TYRO protein tyrosine kinase-binding protein [Varanus komodoensis]